MDKKSLELLGMEYRMATRALTDVNKRFRKVALSCEFRTLEPAPSRGDNEWDKCNHKEHTYAGMSITPCDIGNCPLTDFPENPTVEVKRMDEDCWDTGLKPWKCWKCDIGILEKALNQKPEKCPQCGNTDLIRYD